MGSMSPYGVGGGDRHTPELTQNLSRVAGERVQPCRSRRRWRRWPEASSPPARRACVRSRWDPRGAGGVEAAYADKPFVRLLPSGQWPSTAAVLGSNTTQVQVAVDETESLISVSAIDNLTRGTAGGAVQRICRPRPAGRAGPAHEWSGP